MEEVPKLAKGARRARADRTTTARDEHSRDQQTDGLGSQDHSKIPAAAERHAGIWAAAKDGQQTRSVQAISGSKEARRSVERAGAIARAA